MRHSSLFNDGWHFNKEDNCQAAEALTGELVHLPHTWNGADGQDGGNDYYRGKCWYSKQFKKPELEQSEETWLEFRAAAMAADVYVNGTHLGRHEGGYATFRINITDTLEDDNLVMVAVDNSPNPHIHPQQADFTFYGGLYRDVYLITLPKAHFALDYYGSPGIKVTPEVNGADAQVTVETWLQNVPDGAVVTLGIQGVGQMDATVKDGYASAVVTITGAHLWDGLNDPHLYTATAELECSADFVELRFGCRTIAFDPEKGFLLNGHSYPLCGAARHQDWKDVGNALTPEMHRKDMALFKEMGANTIRLAHYQHDQYFYDLCDEEGMVVWTEIPYISMDVPTARDSVFSQMRELVVQNHHHPSVICWGLSNEITIATGVTEEVLETHQKLNALCHELDATRPTAAAHVYLVETDSPLLSASDIRSYNLYYGWYKGELSDMDAWFDTFHQQHPEMVIGLSEYGADANPKYQTATPVKSDYTEAYQALYHEHMLAMWKQRPFIWAMHVWNMFDFGSDGRSEGGTPGINQKGLISLDRSIRKDAFYIYKAYLSKTPFVHLCERRYVDRPETITEIKVYSNQPKVSLFVDGKEFATQSGDKIFVFQVPISGQHSIAAVSEECRDEIQIQKVEKANTAYTLQDTGIINWFEKDAADNAGFYSIRDKVGEIRKSPKGAALLETLFSSMRAGSGAAAAQTENQEVQRMLNGVSLERLLSQSGMEGAQEAAKQLHEALRKIPREK